MTAEAATSIIKQEGVLSKIGVVQDHFILEQTPCDIRGTIGGVYATVPAVASDHTVVQDGMALTESHATPQLSGVVLAHH